MMALTTLVDHEHDFFTKLLYQNALMEYSFDLDALRRWMVVFVVCDFNVDVGVEVEYMFPSTQLSEADIQTICSSSFPERTNSDVLEQDLSFHFNFRHSSHVPHHTSTDHPEHWYGYCLFRQQRDPTVKRNFSQKSLVLLSQHDFPPLFMHIVKTVSMLEFDVNPLLLESACVSMASWGSPRCGVKELPFLGEILEVHIPPHHAFPLQGIMSRKQSTSSIRRSSRVEYKEIYTTKPVGSWGKLAPLLPSLSELYILFERAVLSEPLIALAADPATSCEFVSSVVDMIKPIPYGGEYRPYLTMQTDFFPANVAHTPRHFLIGITNPFFLTRLCAQSKENAGFYVASLNGPEVKRKLSFLTASVSDHPTALVANDTKSMIAKDPEFLRKLEAILKDPTASPADADNYIRRHFSLLSAFFLAPLNRYLATLAPTSPDQTPDMSMFTEEGFLESLSKHGCGVDFRGKTTAQKMKNQDAFYRRFVRSPGFYLWLEMKMRLQMDPEGMYLPAVADVKEVGLVDGLCGYDDG